MNVPRSPTDPPLVGIVRDDRFLAHLEGQEHWEVPRRLELIHAMLAQLDGAWPLTYLAPRLADQKDLERVHTTAYITRVAETANHDFSRLTADTFATAGSYTAACLAAGGVLTAVDAVMQRQVDTAFVLCRPPGHHAESGRAAGFCLFNNVALGARYAQREKGVGKVLIVDWDIHHGNGIQHVFEQDDTVMYFSTHLYPMYPGTGYYLETGRGRGEGYTVNVPLGKKWTDADYLALYDRLLRPLAQAFGPDLILVAAGFDGHAKDPLGKMRLTETGFAGLTRIVWDLARHCCGGRLVLVLEGGYHAEALAASVRSVLGELCGHTRTDIRRLAARASGRRIEPVIQRCLHMLDNYWPINRKNR